MNALRYAPQFLRLAACMVLACTLSGCGTTKFSEGMGNMADKALETIGYKKPDLPPLPPMPTPPPIPESAKPPRPMRLQVASSDALNTDPEGRSLSLVVRVYKLRNTSNFMNAPYDGFGDPAKEKQMLGEDLVDVKEVILSPGQRRSLNEKWAREASYVGIVGLFREPAPKRWRYAFELEELKSDDQQFLVGAHACAFSIAFGTPVGFDETLRRMQSADCAPPGSLLQTPTPAHPGR
jgi:type VI secretion system protein VasD